MSRLLLALGLLAGCAAPPTLLESAPLASSEARRLVSPEASYAVSLAPLAQAPQPVLPAALRSAGPSTVTTNAAMDHGSHSPAASGEMGAMPMDAPAPEALTDALDAYLAIQRALSRDQFDGIADHALAFADAWSFATDEAPEADPHFWHMRSAEVDAVETHAFALAASADIDAAREAFGYLSAPFAALIDAHGAPAGYDLSRFTCGMRSDLPEGGVWLQRGRETQNPYFGSRMLTCGTRDAAVPSRAGDMVMNASPEASGAMPAIDHGSADHEAANHSTGDHD